MVSVDSLIKVLGDAGVHPDDEGLEDALVELAALVRENKLSDEWELPDDNKEE